MFGFAVSTRGAIVTVASVTCSVDAHIDGHGRSGAGSEAARRCLPLVFQRSDAKTPVSQAIDSENTQPLQLARRERGSRADLFSRLRANAHHARLVNSLGNCGKIVGAAMSNGQTSAQHRLQNFNLPYIWRSEKPEYVFERVPLCSSIRECANGARSKNFASTRALRRLADVATLLASIEGVLARSLSA